MNFIDCLLLTVGNIALCLSFPKLLSLIVAPKTQPAKSDRSTLALSTVESEAPSFL